MTSIRPSRPQYDPQGLNTTLTTLVRPSRPQYGPHDLNTALMISIRASQPQYGSHSLNTTLTVSIWSLRTSYYSCEHSPIGNKTPNNPNVKLTIIGLLWNTCSLRRTTVELLLIGYAPEQSSLTFHRKLIIPLSLEVCLFGLRHSRKPVLEYLIRVGWGVDLKPLCGRPTPNSLGYPSVADSR
ncbi:hypothetical protein HAX54_032124, partial [Datura stramonium]|nr:hypothetical protein [Datura stramonium]